MADSALFDSSQSTENYRVTDTITGPSTFINNMSGQKIYCNNIIGSSINFTSALTSTNIYTQNIIIPTVTGISLFSNLITGANIYSISQISSNQFSATNIYSSQFVSTISVTGSNNIYASSQISASTITGSDAFASAQVASKYLTSDSINQFTSGNPVVVSGVGILNSTVLDLRRFWVTSSLATRAVSTWITKTTPDTSGLSKVSWSPELGYFVTPYMRGNFLAISSDGSSWNSVIIASILPNIWQGICYSSEKSEFVITSNGGNYRFLYNSDTTLLNWTLVANPFSSPTANTSNPVYSGPLGNFYSIVQGKGTTSSSDGLNWTTYDVPTIASLPLGVLIWSEELGFFCYVGNGFSMISFDIINWIPSTSFLPSGNFYGGCWSAEIGLFCAVGDNGLIQTSSDGLTWVTQISPIENVTWQNVCWSPHLYIFVCVGKTPAGGVNTPFVYSVDGIIWTSGSFSSMTSFDGYGVSWSQQLGIFVTTGVGEHSALTSTYVKKFYQ